MNKQDRHWIVPLVLVVSMGSLLPDIDSIFSSEAERGAVASELLGEAPSTRSSVTGSQFEADIRPILREYCLDCHGATDQLEGALDLRLVRLMLQGGDSGPAIVAGKADQSLLVYRIESGEMPPGEIKVSADKVAILKAWIAAGAPTERAEPDSLGPGIPLTQAERSYWAYQPLQKLTPGWLAAAEDRQAPNDWGSSVRIRGGIDALLAAAMPPGVSFSPDAPRETLIRRVFLDVIGLPPTPAQWTRWIEDPAEDWYERMVEDLLHSPHYGERWARHWLDAAGYADSDGATLADADRPWAWKYRDYVIRALNADKPIDQFIIEQLAGDELAGPQQGDWTASQIELLTATGFLRMTADGTGSGDNSPEGRNKTIADTLQVIGNTLLGSSLQCAQCHDHRYDPLSHEDYFALRAVFEPALDWQQWKTPGERLISLMTGADRERATAIENEVQQIATERAAKESQFLKQALDQELMKFEEPLRMQLRQAYETPAEQRSDEQKMLLDKNPSVNISPGVLYQYLPAAAEELKGFDARIAALRSTKPEETYLQALTEPAGHLPQTRLFYRGDHNQPTREVAPGKLAVLVPEGAQRAIPADDPELPTSGRRLAFARWLTARNPPNPLFVRALANRVWMHHFGKGIVATAGDMGKLGSAPTHPELLDYLGWELVEHDWSLKHLHRIILKSTAYRQSSVRSTTGDRLDPENRFYSRKDLQRLDAEVLRDAVLALAGTLSAQMEGVPMAIQEDETGQVRIDPGQPRRSVYAKWRRTQPVSMLQSFDAPVMGVLCDVRTSSTVATQSLMLINGDFALEQAEHLAKRSEERVAHEQRISQGVASGSSAVVWKLPRPPAASWQFGTGSIDPQTGLVVQFKPLESFVEGTWQGGPTLPDASLGWVLHNPQGGHPGDPSHPAIRRWVAPHGGRLQIRGQLGHGSEHGDGIVATVVTKGGVAARWVVKGGTVETVLEELVVEENEAVDFVVACGEHETSDTFTWKLSLALQEGDETREFESVAGFHGPLAGDLKVADKIQAAWRLILFREPSHDELEMLERFARQQLEILYHQPGRVLPGSTPEHQLLVNVCQMLMNSNEFLYID